MNQYYITLQKIIDTASQKLAEIDDQELNQKPNPDKWSKKQILGHLIDSAYNNHQRFIRAEKQGNLIFSGYDPNDWVAKNNYDGRDAQEVVQTWRAANQHLALLIKHLPEELLKATTLEHNFFVIGMKRIARGEVSSLGYLIWDYIYHLEHHLVQIINGYEKVNPDFS